MTLRILCSGDGRDDAGRYATVGYTFKLLVASLIGREFRNQGARRCVRRATHKRFLRAYAYRMPATTNHHASAHDLPELTLTGAATHDSRP